MGIKLNEEKVLDKDEFLILTDKAKIILEEVKYSEEEKILHLRIKRRNILGFRKTIFNVMKPIIGDNRIINSALIIKKIKNYEIIDRCKNRISEVTILFGVNIDENNIYISSAEEEMGSVFFQLKVEVQEIEIELNDE